jgi:hypothetical protein
LRESWIPLRFSGGVHTIFLIAGEVAERLKATVC